MSKDNNPNINRKAIITIFTLFTFVTAYVGIIGASTCMQEIISVI